MRKEEGEELRWAKLASGLSQNDAWASEKVCMRCESVVNMTGPGAMTASSQPDVSRQGVSRVHSCSGRTASPARRRGVSRLCLRPVNAGRISVETTRAGMVVVLTSAYSAIVCHSDPNNVAETSV